MCKTRLRNLRNNKGYSQEELAELINVSKQQVYRWEAGENIPPGDVVLEIAALFGVTTDYLLGKEDNPLGHLRESDLRPMELKLIEAIRSGALLKAYGIVGAFALDGDEELKEIIIASQQPEVKE